MNTTTQHDRKLAERLRSLSDEPSNDRYTPPNPDARRRLTLKVACALAILASATVLSVQWFRTWESQTLPMAATTTGPFPENINVPPATTTPTPQSRDVSGSGYVIAPEFTTVFAKYPGRINRVSVDVGDTVVAGQVLMVLDDASARFALEGAEILKATAELTLSAREIDLALATASLERMKALSAVDAISRQQFDEAQTTWKRAENSLEQARQALASADLDIRKAEDHVNELVIRAPIAGIVTRIGARNGDTVLAQADTIGDTGGLVTITGTSGMVIDADIAESGLALMKPGLHGEAVLDSFPDQPFGIEVTRIAPVVSVEKGTVTLRLALMSPPAGIRPGMAARIRIAASANLTASKQPGDTP